MSENDKTPSYIFNCVSDVTLAAPACSGHMPHFAARVVRSHSLQQRNVSQQPSSFGAWLFVPEACEDWAFLPTLTCLGLCYDSKCPLLILLSSRDTNITAVLSRHAEWDKNTRNAYK